MTYKFGAKNLHRVSLGVKNQIHNSARFGAKVSNAVASVSPIIDLAAPEVGIPLGATAAGVNAITSGIERLTR